VLGPYRFNRFTGWGRSTILPDMPDGISLGACGTCRRGNSDSRAPRSLRLRRSRCHRVRAVRRRLPGGHMLVLGSATLLGSAALACRKERGHVGRSGNAANYRGGDWLRPDSIRVAEMRRTGWSSLYAWIWHTHHASYHAFERAGCSRLLGAEIHPFGMPRALRFSWHPVRWRARRKRR